VSSEALVPPDAGRVNARLSFERRAKTCYRSAEGICDEDGSFTGSAALLVMAQPDPAVAQLVIPVPDVSNRGAFVSQIGEDNRASVVQTASDASADVRQQGADNNAAVTQRGSGLGFADVRQTGDGNAATVEQDGSGQSVLYVVQTGGGNRAVSNQLTPGVSNNGAIMMQTGSDNLMTLIQNDSGNTAALVQDGDRKDMTAVQNGLNNQLSWTQQGSGLSNLQITQPGGQALQITQTNIGVR